MRNPAWLFPFLLHSLLTWADESCLVREVESGLARLTAVQENPPMNPEFAEIERALSTGDLRAIYAALRARNLNRKHLEAIRGVLETAEGTQGSSPNMRFFLSLSEADQEKVRQLCQLPSAQAFSKTRAGNAQVVEFKRTPGSPEALAREYARFIDLNYLPEEINENLLNAFKITDRNLRFKIQQCLKSAACLGKGEGIRLPPPPALASEAKAALSPEKKTALAPKPLRGPSLTESQPPLRPAPPPNRSGRPDLRFATDGYYSSKHLAPQMLESILENLASGDPKKIRVEMERLDVIFDALKRYAGIPYAYLPDLFRAKFDSALWEHLRWRSMTKSSSTYFRGTDQMQGVKDFIERAWNTGASPLQLLRQENGIASYRLRWNGTDYVAHICLQESERCAHSGFVKTFYPLCGPEIRAFDLSALEEGYLRAKRAMIREIAWSSAPGVQRSSGISDLTRFDFGLRSVPCR